MLPDPLPRPPAVRISVEYEADADAASDALLAVLAPRLAPAKPHRENPDDEDSAAA